jgi:chloride channel protein, CIC family
LVASMTGYAVTVLIQPRSILTERLARRGHHLIREYGVDPLEVLTVHDVMRTSVLAIPPDATGKDAQRWLESSGDREQESTKRGRRQMLFPVVDEAGKLLGVLTPNDLRRAAQNPDTDHLMMESARKATTISPDETLRAVAEQMAANAITTLPVVAPDTGEFLGMLGFNELLQARARHQKREMDRQRPLRLRWPFRHKETAEPVAETLDEKLS